MTMLAADGAHRDIRVAVVGFGGTSSTAGRTEVSLQELVFEGATKALADAGISRADIDSVIISASDLVDGRGIASMSSAAAAGAYMKHETRTTNDGIYALAMAALEIWAGRSRTALVMCWNKMSESSWDMVTPTQFEPFYERPVGLDDEVAQGLAANAMRLEFPAAAAAAAMANDRNRTSAGFGPGGAATLRPAHADGVYGMVLMDAEDAVKLGRPFAILDGLSWGAGASLGNRAHAYDGGVAQVAARAYADAGLTALDDVDVVELSARWAYEEVSILKGLLKPFGVDAISTILAGDTARGGALPVNLSGGFAGPYLMQAAGLIAAGNVVRQLTGRAGIDQLSKARRGIAHGQSGPAAQGNVVAVFSAGSEI